MAKFSNLRQLMPLPAVTPAAHLWRLQPQQFCLSLAQWVASFHNKKGMEKKPQNLRFEMRHHCEHPRAESGLARNLMLLCSISRVPFWRRKKSLHSMRQGQSRNKRECRVAIAEAHPVYQMDISPESLPAATYTKVGIAGLLGTERKSQSQHRKPHVWKCRAETICLLHSPPLYFQPFCSQWGSLLHNKATVLFKIQLSKLRPKTLHVAMKDIPMWVTRSCRTFCLQRNHEFSLYVAPKTNQWKLGQVSGWN